MLRFFAALSLLAAAAPAFALDPSGRVDGHSVSLSTGLGLGLVAEVGRSTEVTGIGRHINESTMAGLAWQRAGFKATAMTGQFAFDSTGAGAGQARAASFAVAHELATAHGGKLSVELRHSRLWNDETRLETSSARLGWSLKF